MTQHRAVNNDETCWYCSKELQAAMQLLDDVPGISITQHSAVINNKTRLYCSKELQTGIQLFQ